MPYADTAQVVEPFSILGAPFGLKRGDRACRVRQSARASSSRNLPLFPPNLPPSSPATAIMHSKTPFLLHFLLAVPATVNFYLLSRPPKAHPRAPSATADETTQIGAANPSHGLTDTQIGAVIRNYSFSLLSSCLTALTVYRWIDHLPVAGSSKTGLGSSIYSDLAASLAVYHIGPILRALRRIFGASAVGSGDQLVSTRGKDLGGPVLHLILHLAVMGGLVGEALK
ncbi:hypothetical protein QFC19_002736 [Naganishia cerealis]|uniref:Uncharacterized protein n=1 Tax=Naganishia cerealis TaxID=610337 RepID=A0ACC2W7U1_9TREE|nr:hypothetical protein QFC19_002736 [Naganishia cerealis]